jgi:hypothetical protein
MSSEEKIWADVTQPATLIDGDKLVRCPTLGEAEIAWNNLPAVRRAAAKIRCRDRLFTSDEIDRLYSGGSYEAKLLDALDASVSYDSKRMDGPDDDGAKARAPKWARAECERRSIKKARWVLTRGHRREGIDSGEIDLGPSISLPS